MCNASSWNNGSQTLTGSGFGLRIDTAYRDLVFDKNWQSVELWLSSFGNNPIIVNIKNTFWSKCPELRSKEIGLWFIQNNKYAWNKKQPNRYTLIQRSGSNVFDVI